MRNILVLLLDLLIFFSLSNQYVVDCELLKLYDCINGKETIFHKMYGPFNAEENTVHLQIKMLTKFLAISLDQITIYRIQF